jgi:hypothetical protein
MDAGIAGAAEFIGHAVRAICRLAGHSIRIQVVLGTIL